MSKRHIVIGDVHGCVTELNHLLARIGPKAGDELVFVGDLLDKGPDPCGAVRRVREFSENTQVNVVVVEGNHEDKHRRFRAHEKRRLETGKANPMADVKGVLRDTTEGLSEADVAFLDAAVLFHRIPEHNVLVVHGGVPPSVTELPAEPVRSLDLTSKDKRLTQLLRTRYINPETGKMVSLDKTDPSKHLHWTDAYDGRFGHVVFGHEPYTNEPAPKVFTHATGVDLGCVFGGSLAALVFHPGGEVRSVMVDALDKYAVNRFA